MNNNKKILSSQELQQIKLAWLTAEASSDKQAQLELLRSLNSQPNEQAALVDFIAAYYASTGYEDEPLLPMTQRAGATALGRVLPTPVPIAQTMVASEAQMTQATTLSELRKARNLTKQATAKGLRLSADVWEQFERGAIELASLSQRQLERLSQFFQVGIDQFGTMLTASTPTFVLNRRQTRQGVQQEEASERGKQGKQEKQEKQEKQSFKRVVSRSTMSAEDKKFWLS